MMTDGLPDFATLFADESEANVGEDWKLSPRTAYALWEAAENLRDGVLSDLDELGGNPVNGDADLTRYVVTRFPRITWQQDGLWWQFAAQAFRDLAHALAAGDRVMPITAAEEMALFLTINEAGDRVDGASGLDPVLESFAKHPDDYSWEDCRTYLFHDHDILMLFDGKLAGVEDPESPIHHVAPDVADYRPEAWFTPFWNYPPRRPNAEPYDEALERLAQGRPPKKKIPPRPRPHPDGPGASVGQ